MKSNGLLFKNLLLLAFFALTGINQLYATVSIPFITRWDLSKTGSNPNQISFGVVRSGTVNYTWQQVGGSGQSGSGTITTSTATITGIPTGAVIDLSINPTNFQRININNGSDAGRLTELKQWGTVAWTSMENAFFGCTNFTLTATDVPILTGVTNMSQMFRSCSTFNQPLPEGFNTAAVTIMNNMFDGCTTFNQPLPASFNTAAVTNMSSMFSGCRAFNQPLPASFNTAAVTNMSFMFSGCRAFNQPLPANFNTAAVTNTGFMFSVCTAFNQPLPASFNTAAVTNMSSMFGGCSAFNQPLPASFNTAAVTDMSQMFIFCSTFNQPLPASFNTTAVTNMGLMFNNCTTFNQPLPANFNTAAVTNMTGMFLYCSTFNQLLPASFNTAAVTNMSFMFNGCTAFNQPLPASFNTVAVTNMSFMFNSCTAFNQNVGNFNITAATNMSGIFRSSGISIANYDAILTAWNTAGYNSKNLGDASPLKYCASAADRANLVKSVADGGRGWTITGDANQCNTTTTLTSSLNPATSGSNVTFTATVSPSTATGTVTFKDGTTTLGTGTLSGGVATFSTTTLSVGTRSITAVYEGNASNATSTSNVLSQEVNVNPNNFITRWDLSKSAGSGPNQISFGVVTSGTVNYTWQQVGGSASGSGTFTNSPATITNLPTGGIIELSINPTNFQRININFGTDRSRLTELKQWGTVAWTSMETAFAGCTNLVYNATDMPNLSAVSSMQSMFANCSNFNGDISGWITDNITNMFAMFSGASAFNQNIGNWNTTNVTNTALMFSGASAFNQNIGSWNTTNVTRMGAMFSGAVKFNQPLTNWNTAKVFEMSTMFEGASAFNQDLSVLELDALSIAYGMLNNSGLSVANYDATLTGWLLQNKTNLSLDATGLKYCAAQAARTSLVTPIVNGGKGWTITGDASACTTTTLVSNLNPSLSGSNVMFTATVLPNTATGTVTFKDGTTTLGTGTLSGGVATFSTTALSSGTRSITAVYEGNASNATSTSNVVSQVVNTPFITRWDLSKPGSNPNQISFGVAISGTVNYTWQQVGGSASGSGTITSLTATIPGIPTNAIIELSINPTNFQRININNGSDRSRLTQLQQWGTVAWTSMENAFFGCTNFTLTATDVPILTGVTNMSQMFRGCSTFNQPLPEGFNTASVTNMNNMFNGCTTFNQPLPASFNTAAVTNMNNMFNGCRAFNQPLPANFNTAAVTNMSFMFSGCRAFNQPLPANFNTAAVTNTGFMFSVCTAFNQPLPASFNTSAVTDMNNMFNGCTAFNQPLPASFNTAKVANMSSMFNGCTAFNQPLPASFNTAAVTNMSNMFSGCSAFNQPFPASFNTAAVTNMSNMFISCSTFNQPLPASFNTTAVTNMSNMFGGCSAFNQPLPASFNTAAVTNMSFMFNGCTAFNQPFLTNFNTEAVTDMSNMFNSCTIFNQPLPASFNTTKVTNMDGMFVRCIAYNQPLLNSFNTAAVTSMSGMFNGCTAYNQPFPANFNTAAVTNMGGMFAGGCIAFNQNVGNFNIASATSMTNIFNGSGISIANYDAILTAWNTAGYTGKNLGDISPLKYCASAADRANLVKSVADGGRGWAISGDAKLCPPTIVINGTPTPFSACNGTSSAIQIFTVSGTDLTADIVIGKLIGFQVSLTSGTTFENTLTLPQSGGTVPPTTIYVRMSRLATGSPSGNIAITSLGATTKNVALSGTVNPNPTAFASSNSPVCEGTTINLSSVNQRINVINSGAEPPQTYAWTGPNSFNSNLQNPSIPSATMLASGTYQVTVTSFEGCTATATTSVTVIPSPVLNPTSNSPVCSGETLFLTAKGNPFPDDNDTYVWTGVNSFTANTQNPNLGNVGMNANGIYTVTATNSANCSATATVTVTVKQTPTLVVSNFTNPTPENNPDGTISFTTNLPNGNFALSYSSTGSPKDVSVASGAFTLGGLVSGVYGNFAVTNDGCTGRNNTEVTLLSTPFTLVKSIATGNWESSTTWNVGRVPKIGDVVIVDAGHAVTINGNSTIKDMEVRGTLIYGAIGIVINLGF